MKTSEVTLKALSATVKDNIAYQKGLIRKHVTGFYTLVHDGQTLEMVGDEPVVVANGHYEPKTPGSLEMAFVKRTEPGLRITHLKDLVDDLIEDTGTSLGRTYHPVPAQKQTPYNLAFELRATSSHSSDYVYTVLVNYSPETHLADRMTFLLGGATHSVEGMAVYTLLERIFGKVVYTPDTLFNGGHYWYYLCPRTGTLRGISRDHVMVGKTNADGLYLDGRYYYLHLNADGLGLVARPR